MGFWAEKDREKMPLTWKKPWKVAPKIWASWLPKVSIDSFERPQIHLIDWIVTFFVLILDLAGR